MNCKESQKEYREIGTFGKYTVQMSLSDLREIANKEVSEENKVLREKLGLAIGALRFYACKSGWDTGSDNACFDRFLASPCGWQTAENCLMEIEQ